MTVVETPFFTRKAATLVDERHFNLVTFLGLNPEIGDIIPETGGVRKVRWGVQGKRQASRFPRNLLFSQPGISIASLDDLPQYSKG